MQLHTGRPFWPIKDGLPAVYPTLTGSINSEFVVLGGGITGAILAHRLVSAGREVIVLDRREVASGSTSATTALIQHELDISSVQMARRAGIELTNEIQTATRRAVRDLIDVSSRLPDTANGLSARVTQRPTVKLASRKRDVRGLHADFNFRERAGFDVTWLTADDLARDYGMIRHAAVQSPDSAECDPFALTHAILADAVRLGARVFDRVPVRDVLLGDDWGDDVTVTTETGHAVKCRSIVAATGYESTQWLRRKPAALRNTYAFISEPIPEWRDGPWPFRSLVWETSHPYLYLRTTPDGRVLVGGEDDRFRSLIARDRRIERKAEELVKKVAQLMPHLELEPAYCWAGTFGETEDALPRIGPVDGKPNLFVAACYGGNGITFSMLAAELLEARVKGEAHPLAECMRCDR
ncbi:MAG: FAD-binding oxidoreductase [Phycisphaerae bacterium]|nr:FAD-binding oxidoreductase [Gemmatimonadaceae bacterium]